MQRHTAIVPDLVQLIIWLCAMLRSELTSLLMIEIGLMNHVHIQQYQ
jgi:hypothetical protein